MEESTILDITMQEKESTYVNNNSTKEILSDLLKKMLEHKLSKLEKKYKEESNSLKGISKVSQNLILSLEYYSHKVRKEIYKIRHKNDENNNKKKFQENNNKSILKEEKIESIIESKENILENNINNISYINKMKRGSKSIDAKKAKELVLTPEINNKEKKVKKEKNDVFNRLASKSIGNFKKSKMTITEPSNQHILNSKSKNKKINISKKKMNNIQNKKNDIKEDTPSRPEKKEKDKILLKLASTPKIKQKSLKKFSQVNLDNINTLDSISPTSRESNSKTLVNSGKIKKINSKNKLNKKLKKEEKKIFEGNIDNINDISVENKIKELKIENMIITDKDIKNENTDEEKKESINEKLLIDEEILKNVNKDELLISTIKSDKINEIENNDNNNNENIIKDFSLKESINTNIDTNLNIKKQSTEINNSVNSFNQNNNVNNIKLVNSINKEKEKEDNQMSDLDNIILPKRINNFLDNEKEINFSLINNSQNGNDNNEQDLNKTLDLNISGLSEHLSLEEKFVSHLDEITRYLDINDLCRLKLLNKECYTTIMNILISKTEITIDILEEEIEKLKESNINFDEVKINPFSFSSNSLRAVSLLNNSSGFNLINLENKISREIFIIFGIFFIAVGKKKEYFSFITKEQKINFISNYFKKDISLGNFIEKEIKGKIFDENIIANLYKYSYRYINIISPNRFQKINKDFAIFVFVVKNILEHIGVLEQNINPQKEFLLYKARLKNNKEILEILNNYFDKFG